MINEWQEECQKLDVAMEDGRLVLSHASPEPSRTFEDQLGSLNRRWSEVVQDVEIRKSEAENMAKKWWDFSKSKQKIMKWMKKKESDLENQPEGSNLAGALKQAEKFKVRFIFQTQCE